MSSSQIQCHLDAIYDTGSADRARVAPLQPVALHQPAMHFERQTEFGEILGAGEAEAAVSFDPVQSVADGVAVTIKPRGGGTQTPLVVLPRAKRVEEDLLLVVRKFLEAP